MENNNNKVLLTVIGAATLLVAVVGATFAYFSATGEAATQTVTTGSSAISITASDDAVDNIKPTTFGSKTAADTNADIEKFTLTMGGTTSTSGFYTISMNKPEITIGSIAEDSGDLSDIRYAVYNGSSEVTTGNFEDATFTDGKVELVSDVAYAAGTISGEYTVYVWIENENADQNNLQNVSFNLTFTADATSANQ